MLDYLKKSLAPLMNATEAKTEVGKAVSKVKGLSSYFTDAVDALKGSTAVGALLKSLPWSEDAAILGEAIGEGLKESLPVLKFIFVVSEKLTKQADPNLCGLLACTLAYQRAVEQAIEGTTDVAGAADEAKEELKSLIRTHDGDEKLDFTTFDRDAPYDHPFSKSAEEMFGEYLKGVGYGEAARRILLMSARRNFLSSLRLVLSHAKLAPHYEPFAKLLSFGPVAASHEVLMRHVQYQRWQFEQAPVLGEPFALQHVYIDTECGKLTWGEIRDGKKGGGAGEGKVDAFSEKHGGRHDLLATVMDYLTDQNFGDAIVIQGAAGSGKSSFTLKLCTHLERQGLYPLRIRLKDLSQSVSLHEALPEALFPKDSELPEAFQGGCGKDPFQEENILRESITWGDGANVAKICPYVLILDGWDEISVSANEGFQQRVEKTLGELRSRYLKRSGAHVRVIITGRPSDAVGESRFLLKETPVLTIRPIRPDQLEGFVEDLRGGLERTPVAIEFDRWKKWEVPGPAEWQAVFETYRESFAVHQEDEASQVDRHANNSLDVLGLPLLAQLAIRLISVWDGDRPSLIQQPTTLYRSLVDLTCGKGGKSEQDRFDPQGSYFMTGSPLRVLLQRTAAAMTVVGTESIGFGELERRLGLESDELMTQSKRADEDNVLCRLMISFFFKGGHSSLGCEFLHKSFREYLFAESIVAALKKFGSEVRDLRSRGNYWEDFSPQSDLHEFSRELGELLAPQWLSVEVQTHLDALLRWEIRRSHQTTAAESGSPVGQPTEALTANQWSQVRDGLAEVWHWWAEGVHLRPQPVYDKKTKHTDFNRAFVEDLVIHDLPYDRGNKYRELAPARTMTMDAHLGDALIRIAAIVHYEIAVETGWLVDVQGGELDAIDRWDDEAESVGMDELCACQFPVNRGERNWILFAPSENDPRYFEMYQARINAAGWRPQGAFPGGAVFDGAYLAGVKIVFTPHTTACSWKHANLSGVGAILGHLGGHDFTGAWLSCAELHLAYIESCNFRRSHLGGAWLNSARVLTCNFSQADLDGSSCGDTTFRDSDFEGAHLGNANTQGAIFSRCTGLPPQFLPGDGVP